MDMKKPLVRLSAGLLAACGILLPTAAKAGWVDINDDWILNSISSREDIVYIEPDHSATVSSLSLWTSFNPSGEYPPIAMYFDDDGLLTLNGGILGAVNEEYDYLEVVGMVYADGDLSVSNWNVASQILVSNDYGDAFGLDAWNLFVGVGETPVNLSGTITVSSGDHDAVAIVADDMIGISGDLDGEIRASGINESYGLLAGDMYDKKPDMEPKIILFDEPQPELEPEEEWSIAIGGDLSGSITALTTAYPEEEAYAEATAIYGAYGVLIEGDLSGDITATAEASHNWYGDAYAGGIITDMGPLTIGGTISGSIIATATAEENDSDSWAYAEGLYGEGGDITIGSISDTGVITATAVANAYSPVSAYAA